MTKMKFNDAQSQGEALTQEEMKAIPGGFVSGLGSGSGSGSCSGSGSGSGSSSTCTHNITPPHYWVVYCKTMSCTSSFKTRTPAAADIGTCILKGLCKTSYDCIVTCVEHPGTYDGPNWAPNN
jgi:hypothetical protein